MPRDLDPQHDTDRDQEIDEERDAAVERYLDELATMSSREWARMLLHDHCPAEWIDDDRFAELVGAGAKLAHENGRKI